MIAWLEGIVVAKTPPGVVLNVNGVGYDVETSYVTYAMIPSLGERMALHIHTLVREDALLLYGFADTEERALFLSLLKINGVGAKLALTILSGLSAQELIQIVQEKNSQRLVSIPGIGKKTAERLLLELKDKLGNNIAQTTSPVDNNNLQVIQALEKLGYKSSEAEKMLQTLPSELNRAPVAEKIRYILKSH